MAKKIMNLIKRIVKVNTKKEYKKTTIKGRNFIKAIIKNGSHKQKATMDMLVSADMVVIPYGEVTVEMIRNRKILSYQIKDINNIKSLLRHCSMDEQSYWTDEKINDFQKWSKWQNMGMNAHIYEGELTLFY